MRALALSLFSILVLTACGPTAAPSVTAVPSPTPAPQRATVTDLSVPFEVSEADALRPRGFLGQGSYGRLGMGCVVEVVKTTERAALVKVISCPANENTTVPDIGRNAAPGWVAKSALDLH